MPECYNNTFKAKQQTGGKMPHNNNRAEEAWVETEHPRRIALKQMATIFGLTLSAHAIDVLADPTKNAKANIPKLLNAEQLQMTGEIAELIIPATDTPGALAVNAHGFIDHYLADCFSKTDQENFFAGLKKINLVAEEKFHKTFLNLSHKKQVQLLTWLDDGNEGFNNTDSGFFSFFKSLTLFAYYTSEIGATQELAYLAIPGGYKGDFPFTKVGKAWSLN
jgi:hypothetical protein